ncbi:MAG: hypothetical protein ACKOFW_17555, partial [Planctomycetaceae bacterium]
TELTCFVCPLLNPDSATVDLPIAPLVVLFEVANQELLLLGVLHTARSIDKWRDLQVDGG